MVTNSAKYSNGFRLNYDYSNYFIFESKDHYKKNT